MHNDQVLHLNFRALFNPAKNFSLTHAFFVKVEAVAIIYLKSCPSQKSQADAWQTISLSFGFWMIELAQNFSVMEGNVTDVKKLSDSLNIWCTV